MPNSLKRILVPVDFSSTSKKAFRFAAEIASKSGGTVLLYHVYIPGKRAVLGLEEYVIEYNKRMEINSLKRLQRLKKKVLSEMSQVPVTLRIGRAPVIDEILGLVEQNKIDAIVMGTQGASGLKKVTVGSVTAKIMTRSETPVFLIPEKYELNQVEKIVFTTDFDTADRKALPVVFDFARLYQAQVTFVNIIEANKKNNKKNDELLKMYAYYVQRSFNDINVQFKQLETTSVAGTMENLHEEIPYDMLAMARRNLSFKERFFNKSFTKKMAYLTTQPLLVVPGE